MSIDLNALAGQGGSPPRETRIVRGVTRRAEPGGSTVTFTVPTWDGGKRVYEGDLIGAAPTAGDPVLAIYASGVWHVIPVVATP